MIRSCSTIDCGTCVACCNWRDKRRYALLRRAFWATPLVAGLFCGLVLRHVEPFGLGLLCSFGFALLATQVSISVFRRLEHRSLLAIHKRTAALHAYEKEHGPCALCGEKFLALAVARPWLFTAGIWICPRCRASGAAPSTTSGVRPNGRGTPVPPTPPEKSSA